MDKILLSDLSILEWKKRTLSARQWYLDNDFYDENNDIYIRQILYPWNGNIELKDYFTLIVIYNGKLSLKIDNEVIELEMKDFVILQPNSTGYFTTTEENTEMYFIHISRKYVHRVLMPLISRNEQMYKFFSEYLFGMDSDRFMILKKSSELTCSICDNVISEYAHKELYYEGVLDCSISLVFYYLIRDFNDTLEKANNSNNLFHMTMKYLEKNYSTASLQELADILHYNSSYLSYSIKKISGNSFSDILRKVRMKYACNLLATTSHTVNEVGLLVGYSDRAVFQRAFKKEFGISPSEYRNDNVKSTI